MECKHCGSTKLVKFGMVQGKQRYKCKDCKRSTSLRSICLGLKRFSGEAVLRNEAFYRGN